ncbi:MULTISPECIES: hypothetical protein [Vibrio]|uniref:hypothetical protein n=1 Tax=Vibrio TaxID=662 RepID=UPI000C856E42|nr:hypothetical protein [Vibrio cyclitrophicus]PME25548.1 hypothetical protein BCV41_16975 [Vibrio cyclitrophicus]
MNKFINCTAIDCGVGFSFGEGVQASLNGCYAEGNNIGYQFHENSDVEMTSSTAKKNKIGTEVIGGSRSQSNSRANVNNRAYAQTPVRHGGCSYEILYAIAYLTQIVGYNPFE